MPKEYIRGDVTPLYEESPDGKAASVTPVSNDARISWDREENGGVVQMAIFRNDGTYEEEHEKPQYMTLDRRMINDMIRVLRRARDQAYGKDE